MPILCLAVGKPVIIRRYAGWVSFFKGRNIAVVSRNTGEDISMLTCGSAHISNIYGGTSSNLDHSTSLNVNIFLSSSKVKMNNFGNLPLTALMIQ